MEVGELVCVAGEAEGESGVNWWLGRVVEVRSPEMVLVEWLEEVRSENRDGHICQMCDKVVWPVTPISLDTIICVVGSDKSGGVVESHDTDALRIVGDGGVWISIEEWARIDETVKEWMGHMLEEERVSERPRKGRISVRSVTVLKWSDWVPSTDNLVALSRLHSRCEVAAVLVSPDGYGCGCTCMSYGYG